MSDIKVRGYSLMDISKWQFDENSNIKLPSLQRGFVWKPYQIEAVWDSILRGYPIGAVMLTENSENDIKELLDGQQRSTSIALGYYNPFGEKPKASFSIKEYFPSVWIDLKPEMKTEGYEFVIRVLSRSHPWGYQLKNNRSTLSMSDRKKALLFFKEKPNNNDKERYIDMQEKDINPWESYYPVPLSIVLECNTESLEIFFEQLIAKISNEKNLKLIKTKFKNDNFIDYSDLQVNDIIKIYEGIKNANQLLVPEIRVNADILKKENEIESSQDPTLFTRINSGGSVPPADELIYSIYKAMFPSAKELIESIGASYLSPNKIINLFSRITSFIVDEHYSTLSSPSKFRKEIENQIYVEIFNNLIKGKDNSEGKTIFDTAIKIISQNQTDFPPIIIKQIIVSNLDHFLILLLYIKKNELHINELTTEQIKNVSANYLHILWFNKNTSQKTSQQLFKKLFVENLNWTESVEKLIEEDFVLQILNVDESLELKSILVSILKKGKNYNDMIEFQNNVNRIEKINYRDGLSEDQLFENWKTVIWRMIENKTMILYAQKNYLNIKFKDYNQFENIEDTNRPWDWDHIYPYSWVYGCNGIIKFWVNRNGNYRVLSYDDNRSENNNLSPKIRVEKDSKREESFILDTGNWMNLDDSTRYLRNEESKVSYFDAIISRSIDIYLNWYKNYYSH